MRAICRGALSEEADGVVPFVFDLDGFLARLDTLNSAIARLLIGSSRDEDALEAAAGRAKQWRLLKLGFWGEARLKRRRDKTHHFYPA